jgi:hypothetical protein
LDHPNKTPLIFLGRPTAEKYMVFFNIGNPVAIRYVVKLIKQSFTFQELQ